MKAEVGFALATILVLMPVGYAGEGEAKSEPKPSVASIPAEAYVPGLGDFMTTGVQPHHIKLWMAGHRGNWPLAAYEADELTETFEDISTYQARWHDFNIQHLFETLLAPALSQVKAAIRRGKVADFDDAYERLTTACNRCHATTQHGFIQMKVPDGTAYPDQMFDLHAQQ